MYIYIYVCMYICVKITHSFYLLAALASHYTMEQDQLTLVSEDGRWWRRSRFFITELLKNDLTLSETKHAGLKLVLV